MGHLKTGSFKLLLNGLPLLLILTLSGRLSLGTALIITLVLTAIAYALGDLLILPEAGNALSAVADGVLVLVLLWAARSLGVTLDIRTIIYSVTAVVIVEGLVYHPYLKRLVTFDSMGPKIGDRE